MKTEIIRLGSVIPNGLGGPGAGAIGIIYSFLLQKYEQNHYRFIFINQIGDDLNEFVKIEKKQVHINIKYPSDENFDHKTDVERNLVRLHVIETALIRLCLEYGKLDIEKLKKIKDEIISKNFDFELLLYSVINNKLRNLSANLFLKPHEDRFDIFLALEINCIEQKRFLIYSGITLDSYLKPLFSNLKWKNENKVIKTGKSKQVEIEIILNENKIQYKNLTLYLKAPYFEMMRANISGSENLKAYEDWIDTLPPGMAAIIHEPN